MRNINIKVKHLTKLVILACILAVLVYFKNKADVHSVVKTSDLQGDIDNAKFTVDVNQIADVYRATVSHRMRRLKWIQQGDGRISNNTLLNAGGNSTGLVGPLGGNGTGLVGPLGRNGTGLVGPLGDDSGDVECRDIHTVKAADRCNFVNSTDDCHVDEGFINYTYFVYCDFASKLLPLGCFLLVLWWLFLFIGLAVTADDFGFYLTMWSEAIDIKFEIVVCRYFQIRLVKNWWGCMIITHFVIFCPSLAVISDTMRLSHNVARVTFLAFGNGAPDIFSAIAAIGNAKNGDAGLAIGALFGAGVFVTTVVAGTIAIICPFDAMQRPFLRDMIFYIAALYWTFYILWDKKITKFEAIGFIALYIIYVLVVVIGRWIYTRHRQRNTESTNIQEPSGREILSPLDTDISGEHQPLLSNPDIISLSAVRDESLIKEFLRNINPIDTKSWGEMGLFKKIYEVFKCPIMFCLIITVPVVNYEEDKHHWNRHLYCLQCVLGPVFSVAATKVGFNMLGGSFPVWALTLILGIGLALLVYCTSTNDTQPRYHAAFAYLGFVVAVIWIYSIANEIVNILQTFGIVFDISNAILGLTLLAWGNSIGDFIADTVMARQGFPRMGISACFGGPLFNLLLGIGIPFTIATIKQGDYKIQITLEEVVLAAFLALSLISSLIIVAASKFKMTRGWGIYLCILYGIFLLVAILTETHVIHADIDNNPS